MKHLYISGILEFIFEAKVLMCSPEWKSKWPARTKEILWGSVKPLKPSRVSSSEVWELTVDDWQNLCCLKIGLPKEASATMFVTCQDPTTDEQKLEEKGSISQRQ